MVKKIMIILAIAFHVIIVLSFAFFGFLLYRVTYTPEKSGLDELFQTWEAAPHDNIAIMTMEDGLYYAGKEINIEQVLDEYLHTHYNYRAILAVSDEYVYGLNSYEVSSTDAPLTVLDIFRLNLDTQEVEILHSRQYQGNFYNPYLKVNGLFRKQEIVYYYEDSNITIFDGETVVIFNINSLTAEEYPPEKYNGPKEKYTIDKIKIENGKKTDRSQIIVSNGEESRTITIDYMAERNEYIQELVDLGTLKTIFDEVYPLKYFFYNWSIIGDKIYIVALVMDQNGAKSGVVFLYDYESETVEYIYNKFTYGYPEMYIVPRE